MTEESPLHHGPLKKAGGRGKTVMGMNNFKTRFFVLSRDGQLSYYEDRKSWAEGSKPLNEVPFDLKHCVVKFDLSRASTSTHHPISIVPKNWQGGQKELDLEADSVSQRDEWRTSIRTSLSMSSLQSTNPNQETPLQTKRTETQQPKPRQPTAREAQTEVGALLRECRLDEYTHTIVTIERFENVTDLKALGPSDFDRFSERVGLKLGQTRKLKKRLGMAVDLGMKPQRVAAGESSLSAASGGGGVGVSISGAPLHDRPPPLTEREREAWEMVTRLKAELDILKATHPMADGLRGPQLASTDIAIGKLLTSQIPVVVAVGEVSCATIAADAGEEDNAVRRVKFEEKDIGLDIRVNAFGEPLVVSSVTVDGVAARMGVEVGDLLIDANGASIPTDQPEAVLRDMFRKFKRPVTLGFYKLRRATEFARRASEATGVGSVCAVATAVHETPALSAPQVVVVDGCPDSDCNGTYSAQPHKMVNGIPRYLKNHSFYYLYRTTIGHWMITWFEPDIEEDKGEYRSEEPILTPEMPSRWVGGTTSIEYPGMVVYVRGSVPFARSP